ncbi:MAG: hypothetical protein JWM31_328 [Solirubrobacterales bacterium]|nr:hypothetical protein [Solirubrobacterales bacterium]
MAAMLLPRAVSSRFDRAFPPPPGGQPRAAKVPQITAMFWVLKLLTTGMGEAMSDFMGQVSVPAAGLIGIGGFVYALRRQLRATEYHAPTYWGAVMMLAVFGTMVADGLKDGAGLTYAVTTPFYAVIVALIFRSWHRNEGTLSIHSITTRTREVYYWSAVLATFALGTAAGDLTAIQLNIGFFGSAALFAVLIAIPGIAWLLRFNPILAFWTAYVITRPLGASVVDGFSKPTNGSLDLGDGPVSGVALLAFVALVVWTAKTRRDIQPPDDEDPHGPGTSLAGFDRTVPASA